MADRISVERRSWNMSRIRGKHTKPERLLRSLLHREGFRFRLHGADLPGKPDIIFPKYRTVIFVHGCFWHRHNACSRATTPKTRVDFWQNKFQRTVARDRQKQWELEQAGWTVLTVWECELNDDPSGVVERVRERLLRGLA
ncbi:very short patch repair endonuclease [Parvibaculum sp. MBR-TMA-1.3b-4.2]